MNKGPDKRVALGKGLSALLPAKEQSHVQAAEATTGVRPDQVSIDLIDPNPLQPRTVFDHTKLAELAASIQSNGLIQPLIVRRKADRYELVAGERRLRASRIAKLERVPVIVQDYADNRVLEVALVENIQREDLNPIETAQALERLGRDLNLSHEEIGQRTGKDRATVTNLLRLLKLPPHVQLLVAEHRISMGHARAIVGVTDPDQQIQLAEKAAAQGLSVRQVERMVQEKTQHREGEPPQPKREDPNVTAAVRDLESTLGTRVRIVSKTDQRGTIEIEYYSQDDLNRLYELIVDPSGRGNGAGGRS